MHLCHLVFSECTKDRQFCIFMQPTLFSLSAETDSVIKVFVIVLTTVMNPANSHVLWLFK